MTKSILALEREFAASGALPLLWPTGQRDSHHMMGPISYLFAWFILFFLNMTSFPVDNMVVEGNHPSHQNVVQSPVPASHPFPRASVLFTRPVANHFQYLQGLHHSLSLSCYLDEVLRLTWDDECFYFIQSSNWKTIQIYFLIRPVMSLIHHCNIKAANVTHIFLSPGSNDGIFYPCWSLKKVCRRLP